MKFELFIPNTAPMFIDVKSDNIFITEEERLRFWLEENRWLKTTDEWGDYFRVRASVVTHFREGVKKP